MLETGAEVFTWLRKTAYSPGRISDVQPDGARFGSESETSRIECETVSYSHLKIDAAFVTRDRISRGENKSAGNYVSLASRLSVDKPAANGNNGRSRADLAFSGPSTVRE